MVQSQFTESEFRELHERLKSDGVGRVTILSGSMEPLIKVGQSIEIVPAPDPSELRPFDVVVFFTGRIFICHYVTTVVQSANQRWEIQTRSLVGGFDEWFDSKMILGLAQVKIGIFRKIREVLRNR